MHEDSAKMQAMGSNRPVLVGQQSHEGGTGPLAGKNKQAHYGITKGRGRTHGPLNKGQIEVKRESMLLKRNLRKFLEKEQQAKCCKKKRSKSDREILVEARFQPCRTQ